MSEEQNTATAAQAGALDASEIDSITSDMLQIIADMKAGETTGAINIRKDGHLAARQNSENIVITTKEDLPGIDINVAPGTQGEQLHIPVVLTESGLTDKVYNDFFIGEGADVYIVAGCGVHYGEGSGEGARILNPVTEVHMEDGSTMEMLTVQIEGVSSTVRDTDCYLGANCKLTLTEKLMTTGDQTATSNMKVVMEGDGSSVQVISRSVAKDNSQQIFNPLVIGAADCRGHVQCDAILMGKAKVRAIPGIEADSEDAQLVHEAAIGKIAGEEIIKLMTLGLTEEEAEEQIIQDFLS